MAGQALEVTSEGSSQLRYTSLSWEIVVLAKQPEVPNG